MTPEQKAADGLLHLQRKLLGLHDEAKALVIEASNIDHKSETATNAMILLLDINKAVKTLPTAVREDYERGS